MRSTITLAVALCSLGTVAAADNGHVEYATLLQSDTMDKLHSFSAYSPINRSRKMQIYAGMELAWYQLVNRDDYLFNTRVFIGASSSHQLAPFIEIGTNLFDWILFTDRETRDCSQDQCDPDVDIKAGFRYRLSSEFSVGVFYQGIHFGNFHDRLTGNHSIAGIQFGLHF